MSKIAVFNDIELANFLAVPLTADIKSHPFILFYQDNYLYIVDNQNKQKPFCVDFLIGKNAYRNHNIMRQNEILAKACGVKSNFKPFILDATAGFGKDAFVLANLGCQVLMLEQSKIIYALLNNALLRLQHKNLCLIQQNSINYLQNIINYPDVIYLDPMFSNYNKKSLAPKDIILLREFANYTVDLQQLLTLALSVAKKRVVLKTAINDYHLELKYSYKIKTNSCQFLIFLHTAIA